jgi:exopolysaccharide biosynthesis polyprenyl glycosylphosphotransferase
MEAGSARLDGRIAGQGSSSAEQPEIQDAISPDGAVVLRPIGDGFAHHPAPASAAARRDRRLPQQLWGADVIAGCLAGALTGLLAGVDPAAIPVVALAVALGWPAVASVCGLYAVTPLRSWASGLGDAPRLAVTTLLISWPVYGLLALLGASQPVVGALAASGLMAAGAAISRSAARAAIHRTASLRQRTLILGSGTVAADLVSRLERYPELGLDAIGFLDDDAHEPALLGLPRLGGLDALGDLIAAGRVDRVMIAFTRSSHEDLLHCIRTSRDAGLTVDIVPRLYEFIDGARYLEQVGGIPLVSIQVPEFSRGSQLLKRALDIAVAGFLVLAVLPVMIVIAIAIKVDSRGPVFFTQMRTGRGGKLFRLLKFRSMYVGSRVLVRDDGAIVKQRYDDRVTRVGRFLRRFSLDEAPQLLNVLWGDMSMVGPRPLVIAEAEALTQEWQGRRADLRPGLTGPWQVSGRSNIPFSDMIKLDYQYVAGWSLARDVEILLATFPAVLTGRGAI